MRIYISASWKSKLMVRQLAHLLEASGHEVFDFTNQQKRKTEIVPPEKYPDQFDPQVHDYSEYLLANEEWRLAVEENRRRVDECDCVLLLLPCGIDATADWAYGVGRGKKTVILGYPPKGERSPTHLWADAILNNTGQLFYTLGKMAEELLEK